ncbi:MAG: FMN-binding negative transcriptional regulator, partial [Sphingobium sp.]
MHPDKRFVWTDSDAMRAFVRDRSFGTLFLAMPDGPGVAHVPVLFTGDEQIAFHLARANPMTPHLDGARALFVAQGADAYVSPDWYGLPDQV